MVPIIVDALESVEIVPVLVRVTMTPESDSVWPDTVILFVPSVDASAWMLVTDPSTRLVPLKEALLTTLVI